MVGRIGYALVVYMMLRTCLKDAILIFLIKKGVCDTSLQKI